MNNIDRDFIKKFLKHISDNLDKFNFVDASVTDCDRYKTFIKNFKIVFEKNKIWVNHQETNFNIIIKSDDYSEVQEIFSKILEVFTKKNLTELEKIIGD